MTRNTADAYAAIERDAHIHKGKDTQGNHQNKNAPVAALRVGQHQQPDGREQVAFMHHHAQGTKDHQHHCPQQRQIVYTALRQEADQYDQETRYHEQRARQA